MNSLLALPLITMFALIANASASPVNLALRLKERTPIETLAKAVQDPSSPRYQHYYTPTEIRELVAPTDQDYKSLLEALKKRGFEIVLESPTHLLNTVKGDQSNLMTMMETESLFKTLRDAIRSKPATFVIPDDLNLVDSIIGLGTVHERYPHYILSDLMEAKPESGQALATPTPIPQSVIKEKYGFNPIYSQGINGKGQHIAIATYGGFHMSDVNDFFVQSKISPAPAIDQVNFNGTAAIDEDSAVETELDTEFSGMIAPGAQIHVFTSSINSEAGEVAMFTAILDDNRSKIVNYSWGSCEAGETPQQQADLDKVLARAVAQGVNIMIASGDTGAKGCPGSAKKVAGWPASSPNVVAVGGTSFNLGSDGSLAETAWSGSGAKGGSGGGISKLYDLPDYQSDFQSPYIKRSIPDVAFNANPATGEAVWTSCVPNKNTGACVAGAAHWMNIGGTSMATPQWSGFMALVGEARAQAKKNTLGFMNPIIYSLSSSTKAQVFHDVTEGSNGYPAGPGWDAVTGWGSLQADALLKVLTQH